MRVVLDTNVLVSAVLSRGSPPDSILRAWRRGSFELVISTRLLGELENVLARPRIRRRLRWSTDERTIFVTALSLPLVVLINWLWASFSYSLIATYMSPVLAQIYLILFVTTALLISGLSYGSIPLLAGWFWGQPSKGNK